MTSEVLFSMALGLQPPPSRRQHHDARPLHESVTVTLNGTAAQPSFTAPTVLPNWSDTLTF